MIDNRGQALTLEAIIAGMIVISSVVFALQMTAVTPLSASTSSQHIENQLQASAEGVLSVSVDDGSLERAVLFFNDSSGRYIDSTYQGYYAGEPPENTFGRTLESSFDERGIAYNIYVRYDSGSDDRTRRMVYRGQPSDNAVSASTAVTVTDDMPLYNDSDGDGVADPRSDTVSDSDGFYMDDESSSGLYNVATVEVVVWRI